MIETYGIRTRLRHWSKWRAHGHDLACYAGESIGHRMMVEGAGASQNGSGLKSMGPTPGLAIKKDGDIAWDIKCRDIHQAVYRLPPTSRRLIEVVYGTRPGEVLGWRLACAEVGVSRTALQQALSSIEGWLACAVGEPPGGP